MTWLVFLSVWSSLIERSVVVVDAYSIPYGLSRWCELLVRARAPIALQTPIPRRMHQQRAQRRCDADLWLEFVTRFLRPAVV